jgi:hypothetical protein
LLFCSLEGILAKRLYESEETTKMKLALVAVAGLALASYANAGAYVISTGSGSVASATTDIGNHCDNCTTSLLLPFNYTFFGTLFGAGSSVLASSNGVLEFAGNNPTSSNTSLPTASISQAIFPFWTDLRTDNGQGACTACGIFTSTTGTVGSRIFNIEWVTNYFSAPGTKATFEIQLFEGLQKFNVIYGSLLNSGSNGTSGVQDIGGGNPTQFSFDSPSLTNGLVVTYTFDLHPPLHTPEPTSASLLTLGGGLLFAAGRLRRRVRG